MSALTTADLTGWLPTQLSVTPLPMIAPGPAENPDQADLTPGPLVLLTRGPGAGLLHEGVIDRILYSVNCAGEQNDPDSAEALALAVDRAFLQVTSNRQVGAALVYSIDRAGGGPAVLNIDSARRWHLSCSYLVQAESGL